MRGVASHPLPEFTSLPGWALGALTIGKWGFHLISDSLQTGGIALKGTINGFPDNTGFSCHLHVTVLSHSTGYIIWPHVLSDPFADAQDSVHIIILIIATVS